MKEAYGMTAGASHYFFVFDHELCQLLQKKEFQNHSFSASKGFNYFHSKSVFVIGSGRHNTAPAGNKALVRVRRKESVSD
jgi:hypothetical protein